MQFERSVRRNKGLNLTSLIDVIFLLVVFFMLTSKYISYQAINLNFLPDKKEEAEKLSVGVTLYIELLANNNFLLDGKKYRLNQLKTVINPIINKNNSLDDFSIILVSRKGVIVQEVVQAMDYIKSMGIKNISLVE